MKVLFGCVALALVVGMATPSEARWFGFLGKRRCLPRAIDSPIVRPRLKEWHKPGKHMKHPPQCLLRAPVAPTATA